MKLNISGVIKTSARKLFVGRQECLGVTRADNNKFSIRISEKENTDVVQFLETLLHELLHLYFFILIGIKNRRISEDKQHEVIDVVVPFMLNKMAMTLKPKRRRYKYVENS